MALRDGCDNPAIAGLVGQFAWCPMADGPARCLRGLTSQGDDLAPLLCAKGGRSPRSWGILETLVHGTSGAFEPVPSPQPHGFAAGAQAASHFGSIEALSQEQDNLCPETEMLRRFMGTYKCQ